MELSFPVILTYILPIYNALAFPAFHYTCHNQLRPRNLGQALGGTKLLGAVTVSLFKGTSLRCSFGVAGNILMVIPGRVLYTFTPPGEWGVHFFITDTPNTAATKMASTTTTPTQIAAAEKPVDENERNLINSLKFATHEGSCLRG